MKFVVISDIHSNLDVFEAVLSSLPDYDELLFLGDLVGYGPQPNEVVERIRRLKPTAVLMGNHDYAVATGDTEGFSLNAAAAVEWTRRKITSENRYFLAGLQPSTRMEREGISLGLFHGSPQDPLTEYIFPGIPESKAKKLIQNGAAKIVLLGHTHMPMLYVFEEEMLGNPGSVGQPRDGDPRASFAILTITDRKFSFEIKRALYNVDSVADKIVKAGLPAFLAERLYTGM